MYCIWVPRPSCELGKLNRLIVDVVDILFIGLETKLNFAICAEIQMTIVRILYSYVLYILVILVMLLNFKIKDEVMGLKGPACICPQEDTALWIS